MAYKFIEYIPKINPDSSEVLSLIYTPGVGYSCLKIKDNDGLSFRYTNRENSVAVISFNYQKSLNRAIFLKDTLNIDAYPFEVEQKLLKKIVENIYPNFCGIDLTLIEEEVKDLEFNVEIPVLKQSGININEYFKPFSKNIFMFNEKNLTGTFEEKSLELREKAGGVIETRLSEEEQDKPVAIISDGSAVLGLGNIGAEAGIPVMEGKSVLFKALGNVNAIPLCIKTQDCQEIIEIVTALKNSFSGINLEDISAPRCFEIEKTLIKNLNIPVFHDDQHGTAIVVLAGLLNALSLVKKEISKVKIIISGAGAAATAVSNLLRTAGALDITHVDINGCVYEGRKENNTHLEELAKVTNKNNLKGSLQEAIKETDVFIGLSAGGILKPEFVKTMANRPIIFALANPTPEIMPDKAKEAGAYIVATGRSDFPNQINNSLAFPGLFRGIIDNGIKKITDEIKLECAIAIASLVEDKDLKTDKILPEALSPNVVKAVRQKLSNFKS